MRKNICDLVGCKYLALEESGKMVGIEKEMSINGGKKSGTQLSHRYGR